MNNTKIVNLSNLMTVYNFEIEMLPDNLKCPKCSSVLKDACQVTCGCTFCRVCINDMIVNGCEFCPGISVDCAGALLSHFLTDNNINNSISRLNVKCPHNACFYKCELANMEEHIQICQKRIVDCPFYELGCKQEKMTAEKMTEHIQVENNSHSVLLIGIIGIINNEIKDNKQEITTLKQSDENKRREIASLKRELLMKDEQVKSMMDKIINMESENQSIKEEKTNLANQVMILTEKTEWEINKRRESDKLNNCKITTITKMTGSGKRRLEIDMKSVQEDIRSLNEVTESMKDDICSIKSQMKSKQVSGGLGKVDASCYEWVICEDVGKSNWAGKTSQNFIGAVHPYKYQLASGNTGNTDGDSLWIWLRIYSDTTDSELTWPFKGTVAIIVTDMNRRDSCRSITRQCRILRPPDNNYMSSDPFVFPHSELIGAGLDLGRGVRVSCLIVFKDN